MQARASHRAPLEALLALQARLKPPPPPAPDTAAPPLSALDTATASLHSWLDDLAALDGKPPDAESNLAALVREKHLSYKVPTGAEKSTTPDGVKAVAMLDAMRDLVHWLLDRVLDKGAQEQVARAWGDVLVAVLLGIERHLRDNDFDDGRTADEVLKYRKLFVDRLYKPLLRVILPTLSTTMSAGLTMVTGQKVDEASQTKAVPRWAKYAAFATLAASMSKSKQFKTTLRELLPPDYLSAILHSGADAHLSHYALEIAFRIAPPAPKPKSRGSSAASSASDDAQAAERQAFIGALFPQSRFGTHCARHQARFDKLTVVGWLEETDGLLDEIATGHIKRSQRFRVLSLDYDGYPLLDLPRDSQRPSSVMPDKPDLDEILDGFYESTMLWFGRHELTIDLHEPPEMVEQHKAERTALGIESVSASEAGEDDEYDLEKEKAVVELKAVHAVHVEDLGTDLELMRVTFFIAAASPLKISTRPHPGEASHIGTDLINQTESQLGGLGAYHKLVAIVPALGNNLGVLKKVLEDRGSIYKKILFATQRYPMREPILPPADENVPPKPVSAVAPPRKPIAPKPVAPKPVTSKADTPRRIAPSPFAGPAADKRKGDGVAVSKVHAVERAPRKSSQAGPVVAEPSPPPLAADDERASQEEEARRRRKEVAQLAELAVGSSPVQAGPVGGEDEGEMEVDGERHEEPSAMALDEEGGGEKDKEETAATDSIVEESVELHGPTHMKVVAPAPTPKALAKRVLHRTASELTDPDSAGPDSASLEAGNAHAGKAATSTSATASTSKKAVAGKPAPAPAPSTAAAANAPEFKVPAKKVAPAQRPPAKAVAPAHAPSAKKVVAAAVEPAPALSKPEQEPAHKVKKVVAPVAAAPDAGHDAEAEDEDEDELALAPGGKGRPRRAAASKAEAKFKGSKRRRADEEIEASGDDGEQDQDEDFAEKEVKAQASTRGKKKVVRESADAPPPPAKRTKKTPAPAPEPDSPLTSEPATDYDEPPPHASLSTTRRSEPTAKKYGRQPKVVAPTAAKTRKAASTRAKATSLGKKRQSKKRVEKKGEEQESEADEGEKEEETSRSRTTRSRGAASKKKVVLQDVSPRKKGDKRVSDDIPPPRDLDADELKRVKDFEALKKPRSTEGVLKEKAVRSFSQLVSRDRVRTPPDEVMAEAEPLGGIGSEDQAAHVQDNESFDPGFYPDDLAHVPALDAVAPGPAHAQDFAVANAALAQAPPQPRASSPSPFLDPAKDDTFVERAVPETRARPAILVPDSPPPAAAAAAKARAVTAPALSSPRPQQRPQLHPQQQQPAPRPPKPVAKPVARSPAHEPMQVDSPAGPQGADDSGVHFAPPLGDRSVGKTPQVAQRGGLSAAAAAAMTTAQAGPSAALAPGVRGAFPSALKLSISGLTTPATAHGAASTSTSASRALAPTVNPAAGPSFARPAQAFTFSPAHPLARTDAPSTSTMVAPAPAPAGAPWNWARPEVDQATQVGASLETGPGADQRAPRRPQYAPRSPHKAHAFLDADAAALRARVGPPPVQPQLVRRPFELAPRAGAGAGAAPGLAARRTAPPAATATAAGFGRAAQGSASRFARDRASFAPQFQGRAPVAGPSTSTPRRAGAGGGGGGGGGAAAVPSPARAQAQGRAQQQQRGAADDGREDDDDTLLRFSEMFGRALVEKQRERRERRQAVIEQGVRRHNDIVGRYVDEVKDEALSLVALVQARAAHHAAQCAPAHETTRALHEVGDKARELGRWLDEVAGELGE
ncbi:hypothetical protein JCM9279_007274 [Rhodotorula babjevae]